MNKTRPTLKTHMESPLSFTFFSDTGKTRDLYHKQPTAVQTMLDPMLSTFLRELAIVGAGMVVATAIIPCHTVLVLRGAPQIQVAICVVISVWLVVP